jgi:hypothetical protein
MIRTDMSLSDSGMSGAFVLLSILVQYMFDVLSG